MSTLEDNTDMVIPTPTPSVTLSIVSPDKQESCIEDVKAKASPWCAQQGYPARAKDPTTGGTCYNPWAVCRRHY